MYDVVFIGAHPDDVVLSCGGTLSKLSSAGYKCMILSLTAGENNNPTLGQTRRNELEKSAEILSSNFYCLGLPDTCIANTLYEQKLLRDLLIKWVPKFLFIHNPLDVHPDHSTTSELIKKSVFLLFTSLNTTMPLLKGYFYYQIIKMNPHTILLNDFNVYCDISDHSKIKEQSIGCHTSQLPYMEKNRDAIMMYNAMLGKFVGCKYAEGFRYIPIDYNGNLLPIENLLDNME